MRDKNGVKIKQIAKVIQRELATLFLTESINWFNGALLSVTTVVVSSDLSLAKVYVSVSLNQEQATLIKKLAIHKQTIRRCLSKKIAGKMYKVPDLKFIIDSSVTQGARVTALINQMEPLDTRPL